MKILESKGVFITGSIYCRRAKNQQRFILLMTCFFLGLNHQAKAQSAYTISDPKSNHIKLSGTSSLHDWEMNTRDFTGQAQFNFLEDDNQTLVGLNSLTFSLPVTNLKSDKNGLDKNAYEALNTDEHKNIEYTLVSAKVSPEEEHKFLIEATGNLTISGVTREVDLEVYCRVNNDASITCSGTEVLKMSDYKVEPPSFMWGAMKTGNAITLDFTIVYMNNSSANKR